MRTESSAVSVLMKFYCRGRSRCRRKCVYKRAPTGTRKREIKFTPIQREINPDLWLDGAYKRRPEYPSYLESYSRYYHHFLFCIRVHTSTVL